MMNIVDLKVSIPVVKLGLVFGTRQILLVSRIDIYDSQIANFLRIAI